MMALRDLSQQKILDAIKKKRGNKFGAKKRVYMGMKFDSGKELARWKDLRMLEAAGEITMLSRQDPFPLFACIMSPMVGGYARTITPEAVKVGDYVSDFCYQDRDGNLVVEDAKGLGKKAKGKKRFSTRTAIYNWKKRMMLICHSIQIKEV